jgi:ferrous iron transport protein B
MELPPYFLPTGRGVLIHMWRRSWQYLKKAGTIILLISIAIWFLSNFPSESDEARERLENSYAGHIGKTVTPALKPIGLDDWKVSVSLIMGFAAREVIVSSLGTLYSMESEDSNDLRDALRKDKKFNPLKAYVLMLFVLLSCPCFATFAMVKQETGGWKWPLFMAGYTTLLAWITCFIVYRAGTFIMNL